MPLVTPLPGAAEEVVAHEMAPPSRLGDRAFEWLTLGMALAVVALVFLVGWELARGSMSVDPSSSASISSSPRPGIR